MRASLAVLTVACSLGCAHDGDRELRNASAELSRAVRRQDETRVRELAAPSEQARLDAPALLSDGAHGPWHKALRKPAETTPTALVFLRPDFPVAVVETASGWRFAEDPTDVYAQDTPRHAMRTLVWATRAQRWDVVRGLAPQRYRVGLSPDDLRIAWTEGEYAKVLGGARDTLAAHLADPMLVDAHEASLRLAADHVVRLERERDQWVIVDFLPATPTSAETKR